MCMAYYQPIKTKGTTICANNRIHEKLHIIICGLRERGYIWKVDKGVLENS